MKLCCSLFLVFIIRGYHTMFFIFFILHAMISFIYLLYYYITNEMFHIFKKYFFTLVGPGGAKRRFWGVILKFE